MKLRSRIPVILIISFLVLAVSINPLILFTARKQLQARLPGSIVAISGCQFSLFKGISFNGVLVSKLPVYDLRIKALAIGFGPASIFKVFRGDFIGAVESFEVSADTFILNKIRITEGNFRVSRRNDNGELGCREFRFEKLKILDIKGKPGLKDSVLSFEFLSGKLLDGSFKGEGFLKLDPVWGYQARINFANLDLDTFMNDFALNEKAEVSGTVSGFLKLKGNNRRLELIEGNLGSGQDGGTLTIKDTSFLENMARSSGQALDLVVESFKNYRYNTGKTTLSLEDNDLVFLVNLDGKAGKRALNITLHDFNPGRTK